MFSECFINTDAALKDIVDMTNREGGILGKKLRYVSEGTDYDVEESAEEFVKIVEESKPLVMFGNSTGLGLKLAADMGNKFKVLYSSSSFLSGPGLSVPYPSIFLPGPTYGEQIGMLLGYIAKKNPDARVAFFYSDTPFGHDPIAYVYHTCKTLKLTVAGEEVVPLGVKDVAPNVARLKEKKPDYIILHGFILEPVPEVIKQARNMGMKCEFMGTFWGATETVLNKLGPLADGYLVVNPYCYWWMESVPTIKKIRDYTAEHHPDVKFRPNYYMQGFATGMIFVESLKRAAGTGALNYEGLCKALRSIEEFDTGGLTAPLTNKHNRFPMARIWRANPAKMIYEPETDWIRLTRTRME